MAKTPLDTIIAPSTTRHYPTKEERIQRLKNFIVELEQSKASRVELVDFTKQLLVKRQANASKIQLKLDKAQAALKRLSSSKPTKSSVAEQKRIEKEQLRKLMEALQQNGTNIEDLIQQVTISGLKKSGE